MVNAPAKLWQILPGKSWEEQAQEQAKWNETELCSGDEDIP